MPCWSARPRTKRPGRSSTCRSIVISKWQLDPAERAEVDRTGQVWLHSWGVTHPPISVGGLSPFASDPAPAETQSEVHNRLAPEIVKLIARQADSEANAMVLLESVMLGLMLFYRPDPRGAAEMLDSLTMAVLERMTP
jgi:hypothetical protein